MINCQHRLSFTADHYSQIQFENLCASYKHVEVFWHEVSCGYISLIEIYAQFKVLPFVLDHPIYTL